MTSANLTVAPAIAAELAVDIQDILGTMISTFLLILIFELFITARQAISRPYVAFPTARACNVLLN